MMLLGGAILAVTAMAALHAEDPLRPPPPTGTNAPGPVANEAYRWRPVAIGAGGFITGMDFDASGTTRVARSDTYGAYLWAGDRWRQLVTASSMPDDVRHQNGAAEGVYEIAVAPSDGRRLLMAIRGWVYRSMDRGGHWTRAAPGGPFPAAFDPNGPYRLGGPFMAISPANPDLVLLGLPASGLWRSTDGGNRWARVTDVPASAAPAKAKPEQDPGRRAPGTRIWFAPPVPGSRGRSIWAMAGGAGMFVSTDDGRHFSPLRNAAATGPLQVDRGAFAPDGTFYAADAADRKAWVYRDGAWTDLTAAAGLKPASYAAVAVDKTGRMVYLLDGGGQGYRSADCGQSWRRVFHSAAAGPGDPPWLRVSDQSYLATAQIAFDPAQPERLWAGLGTGVYYADPPLATLLLRWNSRARGMEQIVANDVVQPPGAPPAFAGWDFGIHVKSDLDAFSTGYGPRERVVIAAQQVAWTPADPAFLVTNASDTRMGCCSEDGQTILAGWSEDGGRHWTRFATLPQPPGTRADDPWRMSFGMIAVSANDRDNIVWVPSFNRAPFYTRDRGRSWQRVTFPGERLPDTGSHSFYYMQRKVLAADRVLPGVFYLVHSGNDANRALMGIWRTGDGGGTWTRVFAGEVAPQSQYAAKLRAVPGKAGHLFFTSGVTDGPDTRLRRSVDGGRRWTTLDDVDHVDDLAFGKAARGGDYPAIFLSGRVAGRYGVWRSTDTGKSWQQLAQFPAGTLDQVTAMEADKDVFGRVYLGYKGSGWVYGEPAACAPRGPDTACALVR